MPQMLAPRSITVDTTNLPFGVVQAVMAAPIKADGKASTDAQRQALR